nr:MAG TPA: hypothetical protein [Caudoviricetes sp.]
MSLLLSLISPFTLFRSCIFIRYACIFILFAKVVIIVKILTFLCAKFALICEVWLIYAPFRILFH